MFRYYAFYKPYEVLSQFTPDHPGQDTLANYLQVEKDVYPIGRLDKDSEGLLLLSNDPTLNARVLNPKNTHPKTYLVQCEGVPDDIALKELRSGVKIRIKKKIHSCRPAEVTLLSEEPDLPPREPPIRYRKTVPASWMELTLTEGKNRQVRRMCAAVGFPVLRLVRIQIGNLKLGKLEPGQYRSLSSSEVAQMLAS